MPNLRGFKWRRTQYLRRLGEAERVFAVSRKTGKVYALTQAQWADWLANPRAAAIDTFLTEAEAQGEARRFAERAQKQATGG